MPDDDEDIKPKSTVIYFTDIDGNRLSTDKNKARFDGLIYEITQYIERHGTG